MLNARHLVCTLFVLALCGSLAWSAPPVDGVIETVGHGYDCWLIDTVPEPDPTDKYIGTGLDIDTFYFHAEGASRYLGLTVDPIQGDDPFDANGSPFPFSWNGTTGLSASFYADELDPAPVVILNLLVSDSGLERGEIYEWDFGGGAWAYTDLLDPANAGKHLLVIADALELRIDEDLFLNAPDAAGYLRAQLDDTGNWDDDQIQGEIAPEPTALVLLGLGGVALLRRRRRA
jgi:hypothetical protein